MARFLLPLALVACLFLSLGEAEARSATKFGIEDEVSAAIIKNINVRIGFRSALDFRRLERELLSLKSRHTGNSYALARINYELAEIYSVNLLDIEKAIDADSEVLIHARVDSSVGRNEYLPKSTIASQVIIADTDYYSRYFTIESSQLSEVSEARRKQNIELIGGSSSGGQLFDVDFLTRNLQSLVGDLQRTPSGPLFDTLFSRLMRTEYEITRINPAYKVVSLGRGNIDNVIAAVDFNEINFLQLSELLLDKFRETSDVVWAERALRVIYRPYQNIKSPIHRWTYNKLVNDILSRIIQRCVATSNFEDAFYYISLNKSRMLMEERLAVLSGERSIASLAVDLEEKSVRMGVGIPSKAEYREMLSKSGPFVDFYLDGSYLESSVSLEHQGSGMPSSRDFGVESKEGSLEVFSDDVLFVTRVENGRVKEIYFIRDGALKNLRLRLEQDYLKLASNSMQSGDAKTRPLKQFFIGLENSKIVSVSPDKWLSKVPLDYYLDRATVRAVNFFLAGQVNHLLSDIKIVAFVNPTGDLSGADREGGVISSLIPDSKIYFRENATKAALVKASSSFNVVHLSMHGSYDAQSPMRSKLHFAPVRDNSVSEPLAASEISGVSLLNGRDLIFAAACQTGLIGSNQRNSAELLGLVRPLASGGNRNMVLSLWNVSDEATEKFVRYFYEELRKSRSVSNSFSAAQIKIKNDFPSPYYWAAFYLMTVSPVN